MGSHFNTANNKAHQIGKTIKTMSSVTFLKYSGVEFQNNKPFGPGERKGVVKDLERNVKGYKTLMRELDMLRIVMEQQETAREKLNRAKPMRTMYYKSQLGIRTAKSTGATYFTFPVGRLGIFVTKCSEIRSNKCLFYKK